MQGVLEQPGVEVDVVRFWVESEVPESIFERVEKGSVVPVFDRTARVSMLDPLVYLVDVLFVFVARFWYPRECVVEVKLSGNGFCVVAAATIAEPPSLTPVSSMTPFRWLVLAMREECIRSTLLAEYDHLFL